MVGGCLRGGRSANSSVVAAATAATAASKTSVVLADGSRIPLILRTYWRAPASISAELASGSRPRRMVMLRHITSF